MADKPFTIDSAGWLNLPMLGRVQAVGLTVGQLEAALTVRLKEFVWDARVAVTVTQYLSKPVSVIGALTNPGVQQLRTQKTLVDVLSLAGGLRPDNVRRVVATLRPFAVDVCSGVESAPGRKEPRLLRQLFEEIRNGQVDRPT